MNKIKLSQETADAILDLAKFSIMAYQGKWDEWTCDFGAFENHLNSLVVEDEGFTKPCTCGSTMHLQHHWECLNCKKGTKGTNEEISLRMWNEFLCSSVTYTLPKGYANTITQVYTDWLEERK